MIDVAEAAINDLICDAELFLSKKPPPGGGCEQRRRGGRSVARRTGAGGSMIDSFALRGEAGPHLVGRASEGTVPGALRWEVASVATTRADGLGRMSGCSRGSACRCRCVGERLFVVGERTLAHRHTASAITVCCKAPTGSSPTLRPASSLHTDSRTTDAAAGYSGCRFRDSVPG